MKKTIRVHPKTGYAYLPEEVREHGFKGEVETLPNHFTWVWIKPGANLEQVKKSLERTIAELEDELSEKEVAIT